jgi:hypothetical protein
MRFGLNRGRDLRFLRFLEGYFVQTQPARATPVFEPETGVNEMADKVTVKGGEASPSVGLFPHKIACVRNEALYAAISASAVRFK